MIKSKADYFEYVQKDTLANIGKGNCNWFFMRLNIWYGNDQYRFLKYMKALRRYEYCLNCLNGPIGKLLTTFAKIRWHYIGARYNVNILPNVVGYGFRVPHLTGGLIINCKSVGNNCTANAGVIVGNNNRGELAVIGDNVDLTVGSKVIGGVIIGNNVTVAPNSVVVKDIPDNAIVSGIPAQIIKMKGTSLPS